jgi:hypothetical protein
LLRIRGVENRQRFIDIADNPKRGTCVAAENAPDRKMIGAADGLVVILPVNLDINDCMEDIIAGLGGAERKLVGVVLNELSPAAVDRQRGKQYA